MKIDTTMQRTETTRSLSFHVTVWLAIATAIGMAAYAIYQYSTMPGNTVLDLLLHHSWHILAVCAAIYAVSWAALHKLIVRPLMKIYLHLYAMGAGKLEALALESNVTEIRTIVDGINLMLRRMEQGADTRAFEHAQKDIATLRETIMGSEVSEMEAKNTALEKLADLEKLLSAIIQNVNKSERQTMETSLLPPIRVGLK